MAQLDLLSNNAQSKAKKSPRARDGSAKTGFETAQSLFSSYQVEDAGGYISQEFQDFGYRLAVALDDLKHKSLYMRLAKTEPRLRLERALSFVTDAATVKSKARLFMWKLQQLREGTKTGK